MKDSDFCWWSGKRVLVTGHSGFKGSWLCLCLERLGAEVYGLSLEPTSADDLFNTAEIADRCANSVFGNILDFSLVKSMVENWQPDVVFHLAAQPLVRESYINPRQTFDTNVIGTVNVLDALREGNWPTSVVVVTTDKVYANTGQGYAFTESDRLGGSDPYSASKAGAELAVSCYRDSFFAEGSNVRIASARAGNVIGGGDWANDRLIPDCFRALREGRAVKLRNPSFTRPWQHVLDSLYGYIRLAEILYTGEQIEHSYNFGPPATEEATVETVINIVSQRVPDLIQEIDEGIGQPKEATLLSLNTELARSELGVTCRWDLKESVVRTADWYLAYLSGENAYDLCAKDLSSYGFN